MGYLHIENLYKNQEILLFKECYALEKIHGTSAHVSFRTRPCEACGGSGKNNNELGNAHPELPCAKCDGKDVTGITFFSGGEKHNNFVALFDQAKLIENFTKFGMDEVVVFGEAYGGKCQGMKDTYGDKLRFVAFDVKVGNEDGNGWLTVPKAEKVSTDLGFDFVHYVKISTDLAAIDAERDKPSTQAQRNGCGIKNAEGIVCRPLVELRDSYGNRIICKHKREEFRETAKPRTVEDPNKLKILDEAKAIAEEWVTDMRLEHVLDKLPPEKRCMEAMRDIIAAMTEDVTREAKGEIVDSKEARAAIGARTARLFKAKSNRSIGSQPG